MTKKYDPNAAANPNSGIFGLPHSFEESSIIYIPVPWEATTSYGAGTCLGPASIIKASAQMDLFDLDVIDPDTCGLFCMPSDPNIEALNASASALAQPIKDAFGDLSSHPSLKENLKQVNQKSNELNEWVRNQAESIYHSKKIAALIGGDHSSPFGAFQAAAKQYGEFGILHIDAHSDTRNAYMGFEHSHASIMRNAAQKIPEIIHFVQVGIRDFCEEEFEFTSKQKNSFTVFYDQSISDHRLAGKSFEALAKQIIAPLPQQVWISLDIDGLDPRYCPHTGTPVPGGLDYSELIFLIRLLAKSGKTIIGFDLDEVAPDLKTDQTDEWDANVGMRILYKLSALTLASQGKAAWRS